MHAFAGSSRGEGAGCSEKDPQNVVEFHVGGFILTTWKSNSELEHTLFLALNSVESSLVERDRGGWFGSFQDCFTEYVHEGYL